MPRTTGKEVNTRKEPMPSAPGPKVVTYKSDRTMRIGSKERKVPMPAGTVKGK